MRTTYIENKRKQSFPNFVLLPEMANCLYSLPYLIKSPNFSILAGHMYIEKIITISSFFYSRGPLTKVRPVRSRLKRYGALAGSVPGCCGVRQGERVYTSPGPFSFLVIGMWIQELKSESWTTRQNCIANKTGV